MVVPMHPVRVWLDDPPRSGPANMAYDEALLEAALHDGFCCVRIYRWAEPTLSLGYFQPFDEHLRRQFPGLAVVRRLSGGGALIHHHEITYSLVIPADHPLARVPIQLYERVHDAVISVLGARGIPARLRGEASAASPFLCFGRGDPRDILVCGHKVLGSAQRRRRGSVLQHGALLLRRSPHAPEFPGIVDLLPWAEASQLAGLDAAMGRAIAARLGRPRSIHSSELPRTLHARASELARTRYATPRLDRDSRSTGGS